MKKKLWLWEDTEYPNFSYDKQKLEIKGYGDNDN